MKLIPFKERELDTSRRVRVYRNLNGDNWSLWQDGLVRAHADVLVLRNCNFRVSRSGWRRSIRDGRRNVHAFVEGTIMPDLGYDHSGYVPARYNRTTGYFETINFKPGWRIGFAEVVALGHGMAVNHFVPVEDC